MNKWTIVCAWLILAVTAKTATLDDFFVALGRVESGGRSDAINHKENALGIYQIRRAYWIDSGVGSKHSDAFRVDMARRMCEAYFRRYEPVALKIGDWETLARLHNAGPNWRKKKTATDKYWSAIKRHLP